MCGDEASNSGGSSSPASSGATVVAQKGTLTCPKPSGGISASRIGPLSLGQPQSAARRALTHFNVTSYGFDNFCLYGGWGIRGAYKAKKFVLLLTANPYYKLSGASVGLPITAVKLKVGKAIVIGLNDWYVAPGSSSNWVFKVRHGIIQEIGIALESLHHDTRQAEGVPLRLQSGVGRGAWTPGASCRPANRAIRPAQRPKLHHASAPWGIEPI